MTETIEKVDHETLAEALVAFQAEVGTVAKDADNPFFKSKYADLPAVKAAAQPILAKHGLAVTQEPSFTVVADKVVDTLRTTVLHATGSTTSEMVLKPVKQDPQAQGSAITYARRYAFMSVLGLVADDDDDGNAASAPAKRTTTRKAAAKPATTDDGVDQADISAAVKAIVEAAKAAGVSKADVSKYYQETHGEAFVGSRNLKALNATADYYSALHAANEILGGTEVNA